MSLPDACRRLTASLMFVGAFSSFAADAALAEGRPAKELFGGMALPAKAHRPLMAPMPGVYCRCGGDSDRRADMAGDAPVAQPSLGHPEMIALLERFSKDAVQLGWGSGILIGDISQRAVGQCCPAMPRTRSGLTPISGSRRSRRIRCHRNSARTCRSLRCLCRTSFSQSTNGCGRIPMRGWCPGGKLPAGGAHLRQSCNQEEALRYVDRRPGGARQDPTDLRHDAHFHIRCVALRVRAAASRKRRCRPATAATSRLPGGLRRSRGPLQRRIPMPNRLRSRGPCRSPICRRPAPWSSMQGSGKRVRSDVSGERRDHAGQQRSFGFRCSRTRSADRFRNTGRRSRSDTPSSGW